MKLFETERKNLREQIAKLEKSLADYKERLKKHGIPLKSVSDHWQKEIKKKILRKKKELKAFDSYEKKIQKVASKKTSKKILYLEEKGMKLDKKEYKDSDMPNHRVRCSYIDKSGEEISANFSAWKKPIAGPKLKYEKKTSTLIELQVDRPNGSWGWHESIPSYTKEAILKFVNKNSRDIYTKVVFK
jgi:hypothetical protein